MDINVKAFDELNDETRYLNMVLTFFLLKNVT